MSHMTLVGRGRLQKEAMLATVTEVRYNEEILCAIWEILMDREMAKGAAGQWGYPRIEEMVVEILATLLPINSTYINGNIISVPFARCC